MIKGKVHPKMQLRRMFNEEKMKRQSLTSIFNKLFTCKQILRFCYPWSFILSKSKIWDCQTYGQCQENLLHITLPITWVTHNWVCLFQIVFHWLSAYTDIVTSFKTLDLVVDQSLACELDKHVKSSKFRNLEREIGRPPKVTEAPRSYPK